MLKTGFIVALIDVLSMHVIGNIANEHPMVAFINNIPVGDGVDMRGVQQDNRITSYNVCYTKLLRRWNAC